MSTWALDLVAAAAGVVLVASHVLDGAARGVVLGFLAATYVLWAAGLRVNLIANWRLLEETGTSTNALSKGLFDLARLRSNSQRAVRVASAVGYVVTEVAKEAPYYAGAFGTALLSDAVDSTDALVFLGGANVGAACYEYGVARLTRTYLDGRSRRLARRDPRPPRTTRRTRRSTPTGCRRSTCPTTTGSSRRTSGPRSRSSSTRCGPPRPISRSCCSVSDRRCTTCSSRPDVASEIHLAEYLPANLQAIERWLTAAPDAHDWSPFVGYTLECEGVAGPTDGQVRDREAVVRSKVTALLGGDARCADPLGGRGSPPYGVVISAYCADSATADKATWETYMRNIAGLVRPGGLFVTAALRHSTGYVVGGKTFPSASVDEADLRRVLEPDFDWDDGVIEVNDLSAHRSHGYTSIILASVRRRPPDR